MITGRWEHYTDRTKQTNIFGFLTSPKICIWRVLGKDRQNELKSKWHDIKHGNSDVSWDVFRDELFNEYIDALGNVDCKSKINKLFTTLYYLGKDEDWVKIERKEYKI